MVSNSAEIHDSFAITVFKLYIGTKTFSSRGRSLRMDMFSSRGRSLCIDMMCCLEHNTSRVIGRLGDHKFI
jgi:hypothetical protein